ncbi:MAG: U32 family peptidase C-terminal domain-containing protein [SAR324 cluster bacterium]|nr:U32 family peptidase C-terminal domain-containing protein [SAR324 cluster bacterium]MBL7036061.1 U32 family peptidase C-terminal domain-containing protein [SAR324 cluster bacterium]
MELLAPAGNLSKLKTAVLYGADAVYLAGPKFSLRGGSDNFSDAELQVGINFAHQNNCKTYITLNSFLHDNELQVLPDYVRFLEDLSVDAVIVSDLGVMTVVQQYSDLPVHLSTQASCLNLNAAKLWKKMGAKRLVLGREVSLEEAGIIRQEAGIEVEVFIHGAMCMAYSGNCTISNYTSGRDSNRGGCVQSCRFSYTAVSKGNTVSESVDGSTPSSLMSSKDLRGIELLPKFLKTGVDSIKVEGRMKSPLYAATTTSAYASALKWCNTSPEEQWSEKLLELSAMLEKIPHRGYTDGSLIKRAAAASVYQGERNERNSGYEIAGTVMEVDAGKSLTMLTQNSFEQNSMLEVLSFDGSVFEISAQDMRDLHNNPVKRAKPNRLLRFSFSDVVETSSFISGTSLIQPINVVRLKVS